MSKKIYKYEIPANGSDSSTVKMPQGATILDVQIQNDKLMLWAIVYPDNPVEERSFCVYGTGMNFDLLSYNHLKTIQDGDFVWHVFESLI